MMDSISDALSTYKEFLDSITMIKHGMTGIVGNTETAFTEHFLNHIFTIAKGRSWKQ
jgi:hypothetical protein